MKIINIGCGSIGKRHMKNLKNMGHEVIAYDKDKILQQNISEQLQVLSSDDLEDDLESSQIAFICTPTKDHVQTAIMAAQKDCHLFIEKPLSDSFERVDELMEIAKKNNLSVFVGCNMRFHKSLKLFKQMYERGEVGKALSIKADFGWYLPIWRPGVDYRKVYAAKKELGGGIVLDAIHEIDYLLWIFGDIDDVYASGGKISDLEIDTEDNVECIIHFRNGIICNLHLDYLRQPYHRSCEIVGDKGTLIWDFMAFDDWRNEVHISKGKEFKTYLKGEVENLDQMYIDEVRYFIENISRHDYEEPVKALKVAIAIKDSLKKGEVVKIDS